MHYPHYVVAQQQPGQLNTSQQQQQGQLNSSQPQQLGQLYTNQLQQPGQLNTNQQQQQQSSNQIEIQEEKVQGPQKTFHNQYLFPQDEQQSHSDQQQSHSDQQQSHSEQQQSHSEQQHLQSDQQQSRSEQQQLHADQQQLQQGYQQYKPGQQQPQTQLQAFPGQIQPNLYAYPAPGVSYPGADRVIFVQAAPGNTFVARGRSPGAPPEERDGRQFHGWEKFNDKKIRRTFVRKVYLIVTMQLIFTIGVIALFIFEENVKAFVRKTPLLLYIAMGVYAVVLIVLVCNPNLRRSYPTNLIMLIIITLAMSYLMGTISSFYDTNVVLMAVGICATVCFAVTILSFNTKFDFTGCGGILYILLLVLIIFGMIAIFIRSQLVTMIYAGLGAMIFMMYLAYDTQLIMGGKQVEINPEEYIMAALMLYIDILYIYMFLLSLIGYNQ